ncbi:MAG TPA: hypothetical protein VFT98_12700 [Myxococcota bacterium]|nr:hypothetical protein [Myxococcota bacterium]
MAHREYVIHAAGTQRGADCLVGDRGLDDFAHWLDLCDDGFRTETADEANAADAICPMRRARVGTLRARVPELRSAHVTRIAP